MTNHENFSSLGLMDMAQVSSPSHPTGSCEDRTPFRDTRFASALRCASFALRQLCEAKAKAKANDRFYPLKRGGFQPQFFGNALRIID
ncbi:hypothetical protein [Okeania sp. KiyG1]|uniref:hypothetical protein n=1 Tax=Okeania sp. KiyG1 TaxID=2720165 RepID=UPI0019216EC4|nr:hypothetical protein [Okeania sp. KiyG1]